MVRPRLTALLAAATVVASLSAAPATAAPAAPGTPAPLASVLRLAFGPGAVERAFVVQADPHTDAHDGSTYVERL
jgi:hypothetical protein